jgi:hypothetical protein
VPNGIEQSTLARLEGNCEMIDFPGRKEIVAGVRTVLGPSSRELGELIADRVRFWRWQQLVKVMERATRLKKMRNREQIDVPLKFFVPFAEEASKENEDKLLDLWANLLASATDNTTGFDLLCVDVLRKISHEEVKLLMRMYESRRSNPRAEGDVTEELEEITREIVAQDSRGAMRLVEEKLLQVDIIPIQISKMFKTSGSSIQCRFYRDNIRTILALEHMQMLSVDEVETRGDNHFKITYLVMTDLAYEVVRRCVQATGQSYGGKGGADDGEKIKSNDD